MRTLLFCLVFPFALSAQQGWNFIPALPFWKPEITDMIVDEDNIIIYGDGFQDSTQTQQGLIVAKLDTNGNIINSQFVKDTSGDAITVFWDWGKIIKTSDGGYIATAAPYVSNSAYLIKFDQNLAIDFIKEYPDTVNLSNFDYKLKEVNGGYLLYGSVQLPNYNEEGFVRQVNYSGDLIWEKRYSNTAFGTRILDLDLVKDSTFVFVTVENLGPDVNNPVSNGRSGIYKIDYHGNAISSWQSAPTPDIGYLRKVIPLDDGSIITYGLARKSIVNNSERVQPTLARLDASYSVQWLLHFGKISGLSSFNTIWDFDKTLDNNYIGCGKIGVKTGTESTRAHGWLYKFSPEGDSIWGRDFPAPFPDVYPYGGALYVVGQLSSGNIVAAGTATDWNSRYCWIVKLTNEGCMDTLFCMASGLHESPDLETVRIFPNPATQNYFNIESQSAIESVSVFDMLGRLITTQAGAGATMQIHLRPGSPKGLYQVLIRTENQTLVRKSVVMGGG